MRLINNKMQLFPDSFIKSDLISIDALNNSDITIIEKFLRSYNSDGENRFSDETKSYYLKEYRRLLVFCSNYKYTFKDIDQDIVQSYIEFLKYPPASLIGPKVSIKSTNWKPFYGVLSASSVRQAISAISSLWLYMQQSNYINYNPWALLKTTSSRVRNEVSLRKLRVLTDESLKDVIEFINSVHTPDKKLKRQRWLFFFYIFTGCRISDLIKHTTSDFILSGSKGDKYWVFNHISKGKVMHQIPVPHLLMNEMKQYRSSIGREPIPTEPEHLLFNKTGKIGIKSRGTIHIEMKDLFKRVSKWLHDNKGPEHSKSFYNASTHWLKHSFVTLALDVSNGDVRHVSDLARHADWKTTKTYDHSDTKSLHDITEKMASALIN